MRQFTEAMTERLPDTAAEMIESLPASWPCPGCGRMILAKVEPVYSGGTSLRIYARERSCNGACTAKALAEKLPREHVLAEAGFRQRYRSPFDEAMARRAIQGQKNGHWKTWEPPQDVVIYGPNGVGKTMLAAELVEHAWRRGVLGVAAIQMPEIVGEHFDDQNWEKPIRRRADSVKLLVLDEFGRGRAAGEYPAGLLCEILERRRSDYRATILPTNLPLDGDSLPTIQSLDSALYDRLAGEALIIRMGGQSLRGQL